jgi:hypothetical protein
MDVLKDRGTEVWLLNESEGALEEGWPRSKSGIKGVSIPISGSSRSRNREPLQITPIFTRTTSINEVRGRLVSIEATTKGDIHWQATGPMSRILTAQLGFTGKGRYV